jgi:uncharacterized protein (UPF0276 family)
LECPPDVAFMEVHTENYMGGGTPIRCLEAVRRNYPVSLHGVGLSLAAPRVWTRCISNESDKSPSASNRL